jgi:hypothetical protein
MAVLLAYRSTVAMAETAVEKWVADRVDTEQVADLNDYPCPGATSAVDCHTLSGAFTARLITGKVVPPDRWPAGGIELLSAEVRGKLDLTGAHVPGRVVLRNSHILDAVTLDDAHFDSALLVTCDRFDDSVNGAGLHVAATFRSPAVNSRSRSIWRGPASADFSAPAVTPRNGST